MYEEFYKAEGKNTCGSGGTVSGHTTLDVYFRFGQDVSTKEWKEHIKTKLDRKNLVDVLFSQGFNKTHLHTPLKKVKTFKHDDGRYLHIHYPWLAKGVNFSVECWGGIKNPKEMFDSEAFNRYLIRPAEDTTQ
jgi:hypothetical protein